MPGLLSVIVLIASCFKTPVFAEDTTIIVAADQARIVKVPTGAQTLVIGNPGIADVTLQNGVMIVTGKGFGETNFLALDNNGNPVAESKIRVVATEDALIVQRGLDRQSYSCAPQCQPTVKLGDDPKYFGEVSGQFKDRNAQAGGR